MDDWDDDYHIDDWNDDYLADGWDDDICPTCGGLGWGALHGGYHEPDGSILGIRCS